ncbi:medium-chain fatty acid ethyl ester synthase/esteras-like protein 1 [Aaosphaeria arxii CBS 175.79]|uniref:alcohol O-acetyltransferase n=1 Tax=Aaosphaeria arxii CBS 175.79 TaxID=1450172 RepID=A0A6A5XVL0_9PLEO|nr:medium-chain fatty acid ethyl ester synthase/esteras-like protein 1 [Aaosphaeria arxii CBS 175.79]KAF2016751.1 medium-chain fatty acid ethyl ester synthase/esteras-like protein 1 [Aaosphaeria arxii CBS 175.79]
MFDVTWLAGYAKTSFTHSKDPITLRLKSGGKQSFSQFVEDVIPPCRLNPALFNGHLQTMWTAIKDAGPPVHYKRNVFQSTHSLYAGQFAVDFVVPPSDYEPDTTLPERTTYYSKEDFDNISSDDDKPMLICLHGLSGGSHEVYLRQVVAPITAAGWEACVVNSRGCALSKITTPQLFNARTTWDLRQTVEFLRSAFPNRPLYGIGFSLGANILTNYVAEEGEACVLKSAVACSNPWNLDVSHQGLLRSFIGMQVYSRTMGTNLKKLYALHKDQILQNPKIKHEDVMNCRYLYEFDRVIQGPTWGYPTEGAYYRDSSSTDAVSAIRIPFLGVSAEDDPISHIEAIPFEEFKQNPYAVLCTTNWGGHLSWFQVGGKRWFATAVVAFLMKMHDSVDLNALNEDNDAVVIGNVEAGKNYPKWDPSNRRLTVPLS